MIWNNFNNNKALLTYHSDALWNQSICSPASLPLLAAAASLSPQKAAISAPPPSSPEKYDKQALQYIFPFGSAPIDDDLLAEYDSDPIDDNIDFEDDGTVYKSSTVVEDCPLKGVPFGSFLTPALGKKFPVKNARRVEEVFEYLHNDHDEIVHDDDDDVEDEFADLDDVKVNLLSMFDEVDTVETESSSVQDQSIDRDSFSHASCSSQKEFNNNRRALVTRKRIRSHYEEENEWSVKQYGDEADDKSSIASIDNGAHYDLNEELLSRSRTNSSASGPSCKRRRIE